MLCFSEPKVLHFKSFFILLPLDISRHMHRQARASLSDLAECDGISMVVVKPQQGLRGYTLISDVKVTVSHNINNSEKAERKIQTREVSHNFPSLFLFGDYIDFPSFCAA